MTRETPTQSWQPLRTAVVASEQLRNCSGTQI
jgi:hypothetical protein